MLNMIESFYQNSVALLEVLKSIEVKSINFFDVFTVLFDPGVNLSLQINEPVFLGILVYLGRVSAHLNLGHK